MRNVDIYGYQDFRSYLQDYYRERRRTDPKFSIRFFARRAGLRSQNYLKVVMDGHRSLTMRNVPKFVKGLGLDTTQAQYFEALVHLNQARDDHEHRHYLDRLRHLKKKKTAHTVKAHQIDFFSTWYHTVIFEMACQKNFRPNPQWISRRLKGEVSQEEVRASLNLMQEMGILKLEGARLVPVAPQMASPEDVPAERVRKFHDSFLEKAKKALHKEGVEEREIRTLTIALTREQIPKFKAKLKDFVREMNSHFSTGEGSEIFQLNIQFFKLTKREDDV